jgi:hypothetical protein
MNSAFRPATRSEAKPLIGLYAESGCGKTWSALLLARGFVGPNGKIGMIETEGGRGEANVGREPVGQFLVRPIRGDFSPMEYGKAITDAENEKLDALIIDSASHEWEGAGGVLAMAAANDAAGKKGVLVWQQPKINHQRHFMLRLMQTPIPLVIVCMRAKYPMEQNGNNWVRSKVLEPKQAADILFEMFVHGWIDEQHKFHATKYTVPEVASVLKDGEPISIATGERLAAWAKGGDQSPRQSPSQDAVGNSAGAANAAPADLSDAETLADDTLAAAAKKGMVALTDAWRNLDKAEQRALKPRLDTLHKKTAELVDAKEGATVD